MNTPISKYRLTPLDLGYLDALRARWSLKSDAEAVREALRRAAQAEKLKIRPRQPPSVATVARGVHP